MLHGLSIVTFSGCLELEIRLFSFARHFLTKIASLVSSRLFSVSMTLVMGVLRIVRLLAIFGAVCCAGGVSHDASVVVGVDHEDFLLRIISQSGQASK